MKCDSPYWVLPKAAFERVPVPCGRCPPCKLRRVNNWVFRLLQEEKVSTAAHFVTFTYDTRFVPISENGFMTLRKKDFQDFMKRLRKLCADVKLKYYAVGEYGTNNKRPHYHAVIFNVPNISLFAQAWALGGDSLGSIHVGKVSGDSIAYTMKYIDKQGGKKLHARDDREPEFPLMSKCLGANYLTDEVIDYHRSDISRMYVTREGGQKVSLPRYYRNKIYDESDLRKQVVLVQSMTDAQELVDLREFQQLGYTGVTFEAWRESKRYGRYSHFYANQKNRDV